MGKKKRIEWVDIVKYVCIIMVMLSHLETRTEVWRALYTTVLNNVVASSVFCLGLSLALSVILILPAYVINRWFPFIVGRCK